MRETPDLVRYLNVFFGPETWRAGLDLLGNRSISNADALLRERFSFTSGFASAGANFEREPGIIAIDDATIRLRFPAWGTHRLNTWVALTDPLPDAELGVDLLAEIRASGSADPPVVISDVAVDLFWISDFVLLLTGVGIGGLVIKRILETLVVSAIEDEMRLELGKALVGMHTYRFSREPELVWAPGSGAKLEPFLAPGFAGSRSPLTRGYIDLILVADGYDAADISQFDDLAERVRNHFAGASSSGLEAPFAAFRTAVRCWAMRLQATDKKNRLERLAVPVKTSEGNVLNFSNLARLAEIGIDLEQECNDHPIIIVVSKVSPDDRALANIGPKEQIRSNTQGSFILLKVDPGHPDTAVRVLVHELGHSPLGRHLADEYFTATPKTKPPEPKDFYRAPEPKARNVSKSPIFGLVKWQPWSGNPWSGQSIRIWEGGYEFEHGIFRFQENCRMRFPGGGAFCPVCVEELTKGLLSWGHERARLNGSTGILDVSVKYLTPLLMAEPQALHLKGGGIGHIEVFAANEGSAPPPRTRVELKVDGSSVPETWQVHWRVIEADVPDLPYDYTGRSVTISVRPGAQVTVTVRHEVVASGLLPPTHAAPEASASLLFDVHRRPNDAEFLPPINLHQSLAVGSHLPIVIDRITGALSHPETVWLDAAIGGFLAYDLETWIRFEFSLPPIREAVRSINGAFELLERIISLALGFMMDVRFWSFYRRAPHRR